MPVLTDLSTTDQQSIHSLWKSSIIQPREMTRIRNIVQIPYNLTDDQISIMEAYTKRYIQLTNEMKESSHPIAASLNYLANRDAVDHMKRLGKPFIDIGSDLRIREARHACVLVNNHRDAARYLNQATGLPDDMAEIINENIIMKVNNNAIACFDGAQKCNVKADYAIAVNSLLDLDIRKIPKIMYAHDIKVLVAWLMLPLELIDQDLTQIRKDKFYKMKFSKTDARFAFNDDMSFVYTHNTNVWKDYLTTTLLTTDYFDVVVEITKTMGPMTKLMFVRTPKYNIKTVSLARCIPLGSISDYVKVPNMRYVVANDFDIKFEDIPKLVVRRHIATNLYKFVCKGPDGTFSYERGATYMHGMTSRIVIGQAVVHEEADLNLIDYDDLLFSVILLAALARVRRTKTYGKAMRHVDNSFEYICRRTSFMEDLSKATHDFKENIKDFFFGKKKNIKFDFNQPNEKDMMMYTFEFLSDVDVSKTLKCEWSTKSVDNESKLKAFEERREDALIEEQNTFDASGLDTRSISSEDSNTELNIEINNKLKRIAPLAPLPKLDLTPIESNLTDPTNISVNDTSIVDEVIVHFDFKNSTLNSDSISVNSNMGNSNILSNHVEINLDDNKLNHTPFPYINGIIDNINISSVVVSNDNELYERIRKIELEGVKGFKSRAHAKIDEIMNNEFRKRKFDKIVEIGIAPGNFSHTLKNFTRKLDGYHYIGKNALEMNFRNRVNYRQIIEFSNFDKIRLEKTDLIISDVGDECHSNVNLEIINFQKSLNKGGSMIFKVWINQINQDLIEALNFGYVKLVKPASSFSLNTELYIVCKDFGAKKQNDWKLHFFVILKRIEAMYEMYLSGNNIDKYKIPPKETKFVKEILILDVASAKKFSMEFENIEDNEYQKLNDKIKFKIDKLDHKEITVQINKHNAVYGSGKSDYIKDNAHRELDLIVVPTAELKDHFRHLGYKALTYNSAMISGKKYRNVYFDEIFMVPKAYMFYFAHFNQFENVYLFGDHKQIGVCDFKSVGYVDEDKFLCNEYQNNVSKRVPQDVCNVMNKFDVDSYTTNRHKRSIFTIDNVADFINYCGKRVKFMTYRQAIKDMYATSVNDSHTIHERQGGNYDIVVWVVEEGDNILTHDEYIRVAYTRHTNALIIYGADNIKHTTMNLYNSNIEVIAERAQVSVFEDNRFVNPELRVLKVQDRPFYGKTKISSTDAMHVINKVMNVYGNGMHFDAIRTLNIPSVDQGSAKLSFDVFAKMDTNRQGKALLEYNTCRVYDSKDVLASAQTLVGRYGIKTKLINHLQKTKGKAGLHMGMNKFLLHPRGSKKYEEHFKYDFEEINNYFKEYLESLNKKNLAAGELEPGFDEYFHKNGPLAIKYFMKKQTKFDANDGWFEKAKHGQGVNAWSKLLNLVFAAFARFYSARLKGFLKPGVFYQNGAPDAAMGDEAASFLMDYYKRTGKLPMAADNDFTEFDASQNELTIDFDCDHLIDIGCTPECVELYREQRTTWDTVYPGKMVLKGKFKKQSGEIFTIDFNTALTIACNGYMLEIINHVMSQFKGDDSNVNAEKIFLSEEGKEFLLIGGMKPKLNIHEGGCEFTGYIQTPYGPYPDTLRRVGKAFSKVFKDVEDLNEFKLAMKDYIMGVNSHAQQVHGKICLMNYYNNSLKSINKNAELITMSDLDMLEDYIFNFSDVKFEDLFDHKKDTITLSGIGGKTNVPYFLV